LSTGGFGVDDVIDGGDGDHVSAVVYPKPVPGGLASAATAHNGLVDG